MKNCKGRFVLDRSEQMRNQNIGTLSGISLPAIVGMMVNSLYNIVDRIFLWLG